MKLGARVWGLVAGDGPPGLGGWLRPVGGPVAGGWCGIIFVR